MTFLDKILFWRKKPTVESVSMAVAVRNALHICVDETTITDDQFEALYCTILENEVYGRRNAAETIDAFFKDHGITIE